jgi:hypothetical protein
MAVRHFRVPITVALSAVPLVAVIAVAGSAQATTTPNTVVETSVAESNTAAVEILSPDEPWAGASLGDWGAAWWQWAVSLPEDIHPGSDTTGERCGYGQHGPTFFLPPSLTAEPPFSYECVVPEGTAIYVVVSVGNCSSVEPEPYFGGNEEELRDCISRDEFDYETGIEAAVNGHDIANLDSYRATTPMFTLNVPEDPIFDFFPQGVALVMAENYGFMIAPPPPGEYVITQTWMVDNTPETYTVNVTVDAPLIIEPGTPLSQAGDEPETTDAPPTTADEATTDTPASTTAETTVASSAASGSTLGVTDACALIPDDDAATATGLSLGEGVSGGDERRRVCTFQADNGEVGITIGVESGGRFDDKAEVSRQSLGDEGQPIDDLGDRALFFYADDDLPEGVGGVLVAVGDVTIDVTMQGLDEATMRDASVALAELAVRNL